MRQMSDKNNKHIIFGLGQSGLSCARYFDRIGQPYGILDTRQQPPGISELDNLSLCTFVQLGEADEVILKDCQQLIVSPGIDLNIPFIKKAIDLGVDVCGDVEIFARNCDKTVVAITGSNGKSTVTDLTDRLISAAGLNSQKGGNIGLPVLDFLPQDSADIYVLELSSFQLDSTHSLAPKVAVLLNLSEDHLDRYQGFEQYCHSKQSIFRNSEFRVFNQDDRLTYPKIITENCRSFSIATEPNIADSNVSYIKNNSTSPDLPNHRLVVKQQTVIASSSLNITGKHNLANVLASLNILDCLDIKIDNKVLCALEQYKGLNHRFQLVLRKNNVTWINDSKATNVGATIAALESVDLSGASQLVLIAGGDSKQSDLNPLVKYLDEHVTHMVLIGKDAKLFSKLSSKVKSYIVDNMQQAVIKALSIINGSATILLSPACSSLDMYINFEDRGNDFIASVRKYA